MTIEKKIHELAERYSRELEERISARVAEMESDDKSHYLIYRVLGIEDEEGRLIDVYQNKGRFLYKYAGAFLEEAAFLCFKERFPRAKKERIENTLGRRPRQFEIDCLIGIDAIELKWRDATTDGDHITKEHTRIQAIKAHGYKPVREMFYYPNREQAIRIQQALKTIYDGVGGEYYAGDDAWDYVYRRTGVDLKGILIQIVRARKNRKKR
ncbi:MAG: ApaLI family restriction endonuclease [Acidobacteriota bacterium]